MKRALIGLSAILGLLVGVAAGQFGGMGGRGGGPGGMGIGGMGFSREPWKDKEPPWLIRLNVMENVDGPIALVPERFTVGVGDWVELYAAGPAPPNNHQQPYKVEIEILGEAVDKIAAVRPAKLVDSTIYALDTKSHPVMVPYTLSVPVDAMSQRHFFLRGKSVGKATIKSTVARGGTWKEVREFEVTVVEHREAPPEVPRGFQ